MHNKRIIGKHWKHLQHVESTNDYLKDIISKNNPKNGTAISAQFQSKGKGQFGNTWLGNADENIYLSIYIEHNNLTVSQLFSLNAFVSFALLNYLKLKTPNQDIHIKWPNDILINDKKVCGVLIENAIQGNLVSHSIIGIGLNLNQKQFPNFLPDATSIYQEINQSLNIEEEIELLLVELDLAYSNFNQDWREEYHKFLWKHNDTVNCTAIDKGYVDAKGTILGVDELGRLILEVNNSLEYYVSGSIKLALSK